MYHEQSETAHHFPPPLLYSTDQILSQPDDALPLLLFACCCGAFPGEVIFADDSLRLDLLLRLNAAWALDGEVVVVCAVLLSS